MSRSQTYFICYACRGDKGVNVLANLMTIETENWIYFREPRWVSRCRSCQFLPRLIKMKFASGAATVTHLLDVFLHNWNRSRSLEEEEVSGTFRGEPAGICWGVHTGEARRRRTMETWSKETSHLCKAGETKMTCSIVVTHVKDNERQAHLHCSGWCKPNTGSGACLHNWLAASLIRRHSGNTRDSWALCV